MVSFFPSPYPDELLYSILARYHIRSGNTSFKVTLRELFNVPRNTATADLPCNLDLLVKNLPLFSKHTVEELIQKHTLYPFYAPFLPLERASLVLQSMRSESGSDIHRRAGIMASSVTTPRYFRFCPLCLKEDLQEYGEAYWHRLHQTPGVLVCPVHAIPLSDSIAPIQGFSRHQYCAASVQNCPIDVPTKSYDSSILKKLLLLAKDICWLINSDLPHREPSWFRNQYKALLIERGLASTVTHKTYQKNLADSFLYFYGCEFLESLDSGVSYDEPHSWLFQLLCKRVDSSHPVRHLLMIRFLATSIKEFFTTNYDYRPFGESPWLCLNVTATHYLKPVVTNLVISRNHDRNYDASRPVGTFRCSCGFIYTRTGPDKTEDDKYRIGFVKAYGHVWEEKLRELVETRKLNVHEIASQLNIDPRTIKRHAMLLGLETPWKSLPQSLKEPSKNNETCLEKIRVKHRSDWKALQKQHKGLSKTALGRLAPSTYQWLGKKDKEWLDQNSPKSSITVTVNNRVNWEKRDELILAQVKNAVQLTLSAEKPIRITIGRIGSTIGHLRLLEQQLDKMPLTKAYLESVTEEVEDYQVRRIKWAIKFLEERGEKVTLEKTRRLAGLRSSQSQKVRVILDSELH